MISLYRPVENASECNGTDLFEILGDPETEQLTRLDGISLGDSPLKQLVEPARWDNWTDKEEEDIRIVDFGEAFMQGVEWERLAQSNISRGSEAISTKSFDYRVDLWRAEIVARKPCSCS